MTEDQARESRPIRNPFGRETIPHMAIGVAAASFPAVSAAVSAAIGRIRARVNASLDRWRHPKVCPACKELHYMPGEYCGECWDLITSGAGWT
jgi:hypothetical protein